MTTRIITKFFVIFLGFVVFAMWPSAPVGGDSRVSPTRIISLIPAVTEMLYALRAGAEVVAVSSFDDYPAEVGKLPRVGALLDPDLEKILALKPDLVVVYESQLDLRRQLERARIPTFVYKHAGLADVTATIRQLGTRIGRDTEAGALVARIDTDLASIRSRVGARPKPKTMLVFGRDALALRGIYASGGVGFLHDMLIAAGADNIFGDIKQQSVQATTELILARAPEVILEIRAGAMTTDHRAREQDVWRVLASVPAVRTGRVSILTDPRTVVPGPRVAEGTGLIARVLHPQAFER